MRKHTCHLDLRQRSLYVTIGQKNWVQKLIDNRKKTLLDNHEKKLLRQPRGEVSRQAKFFQPTQPFPKRICDRSGQPDNKHEVFVDTGETSWSGEIKEKSLPWSREIKEKSSHEELCSFQIDQGNLISRLARLELRQICLKKSELSKLTIDQGNLVNMKSHYEQLLKYIVRLRRSTPTVS